MKLIYTGLCDSLGYRWNRVIASGDLFYCKPALTKGMHMFLPWNLTRCLWNFTDLSARSANNRMYNCRKLGGKLFKYEGSIASRYCSRGYYSNFVHSWTHHAYRDLSLSLPGTKTRRQRIPRLVPETSTHYRIAKVTRWLGQSEVSSSKVLFVSCGSYKWDEIKFTSNTNTRT